MFLNIQLFREKLDTGRICLGSGVTLADPAVTEALGSSVDFVCIDLEQHSAHLDSLSSHLMAARAVQTAALVRAPNAESAHLRRILDAGAEGIIVPRIRTAGEAKEAVADCRYAPLGRRTLGPRRVMKYGRQTTQELLRYANQHLFVAVQIDSKEGLEEIDAIVGVPGLDAVVVSMDGLSASLGQIGRLDSPEIKEAVARLIDKVRGAGLYAGVDLRSPEPEMAFEAARLGAQFLQTGDDFSHMTRHADRLYSDIRRRTEELSTGG